MPTVSSRTMALVGALAFVGGGAVVAWSAGRPVPKAPPPARVALRLEEGAKATGVLEAARDGTHRIDVELPRVATADEMGRAIGGGWFGHEGPRGVGVVVEVREGERVVGRGASDDATGGTATSGAFGVPCGTFEARAGVRYTLDARATRAFPMEAARAAEVVVAPAGRTAGDERAAEGMRRGLVSLAGVAALALGSVLLVGAYATRRGRRPPPDARPPA